MIKRGADVATFAGDLFDTPDPDNETLGVVVRNLLRLSQVGVECILVSGNHDTPKSSRTHIYSVLNRLASNIN